MLDPATASGAALAAYAELLCRRSAPLHVGILATRAHDDPVGGAAAAAAAAATAVGDATAEDGDAAAAPRGAGGRLLQRVAAAGGRVALKATLRRLAKAGATAHADQGTSPPPSSPSQAEGLVTARLGVGVLRAAHAEGVGAAAAGGKKKKKKKGKAAEAAEASAAGAEVSAAADAAEADGFDSFVLGGGDTGMEAQLEAAHAWAEARGLAPGGEGCGGGCVLLNGLLLRLASPQP